MIVSCPQRKIIPIVFCLDKQHCSFTSPCSTVVAFADSADQDQTAQNVQSDLGSSLSDVL